MPAHQAGKPRVSSTVTKRNPRPRKYATASERQAAYRARAPEVCFRAEPKTVDTLDRIADTLDQSRADVLLSMTKFALANHDWARFGLTHKPLPYGYGMVEERAENPQPIWKRTRPKSLGKPVPLTPKQKAAAKRRAAAAGRKYPNLVDNIAASRMENPTVKKPTPAQLAARARFAEMARSGAFKKKAATKRKKNPDGMGSYGPFYGDTDAPMTEAQIERKAESYMDRLDRQLMGNEITQAVYDREVKALNKWVKEKYAKRRKINPAKKTVSQKISQLTREGYPQKQAVAIALEEQRRGKVRKNNPTDMTVAQTILAQLGGDRFIAMTGAKNFIGGTDFLGFTIPRNMSPANRVTISYSPGRDLYRMSFIKASRSGLDSKEIQRFDDVYADQLQPLFTQVTGMYTSLGTMGRKSNPATGSKKSRTKLNPVGDTIYVVHNAEKPANVLGVFSTEKKAIATAQKAADMIGLKFGITKHTVRG